MRYPAKNQQILLLLFLLIALALSTQVIFAQDDDAAVLPITEDVNYQVRSSDTLETIGALFDVLPACITERNDLESPRLEIGQTLLITVDCPLYEGEMEVFSPREIVTYEEPCQGYVVQPSDTLDVIGQALDVSAVSLQIANDISGGVDVEVGMCLEIPEDAPPYGVYPALDTPSDTDETSGRGGGMIEGETYVIQPNDTLDLIAQQFDVSVVSLQHANQLFTGADVFAGMTIVIPDDAPPYGVYPALDIPADTDETVGQGGGMIEGETYVIQPNDTLDLIAQQFDVSVVSLQHANQLFTGADVLAGMTIIIPDDAPPYGVYPALDTPADTDETAGQGGALIEGETYVIQPNDTLDVIAQLFDVSVVSLQQANQLFTGADVLSGMTIVIPDDAPPYGVYPALDMPSDTDETSGQGGGMIEGETYVVQPMDTLDIIGATFNRDVDCIAENNSLARAGQLSPGQTLIIPDDCPIYVGELIPPLSLVVSPVSEDEGAESPQEDATEDESASETGDTGG